MILSDNRDIETKSESNDEPPPLKDDSDDMEYPIDSELMVKKLSLPIPKDPRPHKLQW